MTCKDSIECIILHTRNREPSFRLKIALEEEEPCSLVKSVHMFK